MLETIKAYGASDAEAVLKPSDIKRRAIGNNDIKIDITHCGVCHSDIHTVRNDWKGSTYPVVPGHEIIGKITEIGKTVTNFKTGDIILFHAYNNSNPVFIFSYWVI